jgi:hypothetical protein
MKAKLSKHQPVSPKPSYSIRLPAVRYSLLTTHYSLLTTQYPIPNTNSLPLCYILQAAQGPFKVFRRIDALAFQLGFGRTDAVAGLQPAQLFQ